MSNPDLVIKQLEESMQNCQVSYDNITKQMEQLNAQFEDLKAKREQVRGEFTAYYNLKQQLVNTRDNECHPEGIPQEPVELTQDTVIESIPDVEEEPVSESKEEKEVVEKTEDLTEIKADNIINVMQNANTKKSDVPDYLAQDYNK